MISIIVPIHNIEKKWVVNLIYSLRKQTSKDFEVIFIDDNSKNDFNHKNLIENNKFIYIKKNDHYPNLGKARDFGINHTKGDYIWFIDGDDLITEDAIEYLNNKINNNKDLDLIFFNFKRVFNEKEFYVNKKRKYKEKIVDSNNLDYIILSSFLANEIKPDWRVCISKKFIKKNNIKHSDKLNFFEDIYYNGMYLSHFKRALFTNKILYFYNRLNTSSILNTINDNQFCLETFAALNEMYFDLNNKNKILNYFIISMYLPIIYQFKFNGIKQRYFYYLKYIGPFKQKAFFQTQFMSRYWILTNIANWFWIIFGTIFFGKKYK